VELHGANVVEVAEECEEAAAQLVVPDLDLVVVAARYDQRLDSVKVYAAHRAVVLVEPLQKHPHATANQGGLEGER